MVASSKAANGGEAVSWLGVDACIREGEVSETAAGRSGAILDILDTRLTPESDIAAASPPATGGSAQGSR